MKLDTTTIIHRLVRIGEAARAWDRLRRESVRLHAERNGCQCEAQTEAYGIENGEVVEIGMANDPCWKARYSDDNGRPVYAPVEDWCDSCRERQSLHAQFRETNRKRGAALRRLQRLAGDADLNAMEGRA